MAAAQDRAAVAQGITPLLSKLSDPDPVIRFMQLNDLANILVAPASTYVSGDTHTAARIVEGLLKSLSDSNGEVQNQALKWQDVISAENGQLLTHPVSPHSRLVRQERSSHHSLTNSRTSRINLVSMSPCPTPPCAL